MDHVSSAGQLTAELERLSIRALRSAYYDVNHTFFKGLLRIPTLELSASTTRLGSWIREGRRLELSRSLLVDHGWGVVVEVLKHEMAHQYVDEILACTDETAHGPTFRHICAERGIDARSAGAPGPGQSAHGVLERVSKLLALAESPNEHEAQAAMSAAQRLMLKYNLDEIGRASGSYTFRHLGRPTGRVTEAERILASIVSKHFFVDAIWVPVWRPTEGKRGRVLEVCGSVENLEMAEYVHDFLTQTAERLWREHKRKNGIRKNRDRRPFIAGVMAGFRDKLDAEARKSAREGLVWVGDPELGRYFRQRHPRVRYTRHLSSLGSEAHQHGRQAGRQVVLHRGVKRGPSGGPKLLGR